MNMTRETVIQNILSNYGQYISKEDVESMVDSGKEQGLTYDLIYLTLKAQLSQLAGEEFYCTSSDMAKALNVSEDEINRLIEESREELAAVGENPDDYFKTVQTTRCYFYKIFQSDKMQVCNETLYIFLTHVYENIY